MGESFLNSNINIRRDLLIDASDIKLRYQIGEGSYGQVWKGTMAGFDVTVKKLVVERTTREVIKTIENEINLLASHTHPNVVRLYGACICPNEIWIVMEYADGGSLYSLLADSGTDIPWETRWRWIKEVASAVAFLHKRGIIHRDLKSSNFLIIKDSIKICDFRKAVIATLAPGRPLGTISTARWLAPECSAREPVFDKKTDVFAMGMVIWEIVSRDIPFRGMQDTQVVHLVTTRERPDIPNDCPEGAEKVIKKCWAHIPTERPTAEEVTGLIQHEIMRIYPPALPPEFPPPRRSPILNLEFSRNSPTFRSLHSSSSSSSSPPSSPSSPSSDHFPISSIPSLQLNAATQPSVSVPSSTLPSPLPSPPALPSSLPSSLPSHLTGRVLNSHSSPSVRNRIGKAFDRPPSPV